MPVKQRYDKSHCLAAVCRSLLRSRRKDAPWRHLSPACRCGQITQKPTAAAVGGIMPSPYGMVQRAFTSAALCFVYRVESMSVGLELTEEESYISQDHKDVRLCVVVACSGPLLRRGSSCSTTVSTGYRIVK